jgi:hypothetical protein
VSSRRNYEPFSVSFLLLCTTPCQCGFASMLLLVKFLSVKKLERRLSNQYI